MSTSQNKTLRIKTRELALISVFSALWVAAEVTLGPIIGKFPIGPFSLHGVVNRLMGWLLMFVLAELTGKFGRVSIMASIAALVTRMFRRSPYAVGGLVIGVGYALGGLIFDLLFMYKANNLEGLKLKIYLLIAATISGVIASAPYVFYNLFALGVYPIILRSPIYVQSTVKGTVFSIFGVSIGLSFSSRIAFLLPAQKIAKPLEKKTISTYRQHE